MNSYLVDMEPEFCIMQGLRDIIRQRTARDADAVIGPVIDITNNKMSHHPLEYWTSVPRLPQIGAVRVTGVYPLSHSPTAYALAMSITCGMFRLTLKRLIKKKKGMSINELRSYRNDTQHFQLEDPNCIDLVVDKVLELYSPCGHPPH